MTFSHLALFILLVSLVKSEGQEQCKPGFSEQRYAFTMTRKLLERGRVVGKVSFTSCSANNRALYSPDDTRFRVFPDGKVAVKRQITLHDGSVSFVLNAWDAKGTRHSVPIFVWNEREQQDLSSAGNRDVNITGPLLKRQKRSIFMPLFNISENPEDPYPKQTDKEMSGGSDSLLSTHVLNTAQGIPAKGLTITLSKLDASQGRWIQVSRSVTNEDGRCPGLLRGEPLTTGTFQLRFDTKDYWKQMQQDSFYPYVEVVFTITDSKQKYHVPLLLTPFSYTTYRGS